MKKKFLAWSNYLMMLKFFIKFLNFIPLMQNKEFDGMMKNSIFLGLLFLLFYLKKIHHGQIMKNDSILIYDFVVEINVVTKV